MANSGPRRLTDLKREPMLEEVLEALYEREADAARVARILAKLEPQLEAAPSEPAVSAPVVAMTSATRQAASGSMLGKSKLILKLALGATLLAIAPAVWLHSEQPAPQLHSAPERPLAPLPVVQPMTPVTRDVAAPPAPAAGSEPAPAPIQHVPETSHRAGSPAKGGAAVRAPARRAAGAVPAARESGTHIPANEAPPASASANHAEAGEAIEPPSAAPVEAPARKEVVQRPERALKARSVSPPRSELQLLTLARSVTPSDPAHALRLLTEHANNYPNGVLTPEREVLAIDALQRLGKAEEAAARRKLFRQNYPESFHLRK